MSKMPFELRENEEIRKQETAMFLKSKLNGISGRLILTNERLVFAHKNINLFGLIGALFMKEKVLFDWDRNTLGKHEKTNHGRSKNVIAITDPAGEEKRFVLKSSYEEWDGLLSN